MNCTMFAVVVRIVAEDVCCGVDPSDADVATFTSPNGSKLVLPFSSTILSIAPPQLPLKLDYFLKDTKKKILVEYDCVTSYVDLTS